MEHLPQKLKLLGIDLGHGMIGFLPSLSILRGGGNGNKTNQIYYSNTLLGHLCDRFVLYIAGS